MKPVHSSAMTISKSGSAKTVLVMLGASLCATSIVSAQPATSVAELSQQIEAAPDAGLYLARGIAYLDLDDPPHAVADFSAALGLGINENQVWTLRGRAYNQMGDYVAGIADLNAAIRLDPANARAYQERGFAYGQAGEFASALSDLDQAIFLDPRDLRSRTLRGAARQRLGDTPGAIADFSVALEQSPGNRGLFLARALVHRAAGDLQRAGADLTQALEISPDANAYRLRADIYHELELTQKVIEDLSQAIAMEAPTAPSLAEDLVRRGVARRQLGDSRAALVDFEQALRVDPKNLEAARLVGEVRAEAGVNAVFEPQSVTEPQNTASTGIPGDDRSTLNTGILGRVNQDESTSDPSPTPARNNGDAPVSETALAQTTAPARQVSTTGPAAVVPIAPPVPALAVPTPAPTPPEIARTLPPPPASLQELSQTSQAPGRLSNQPVSQSSPPQPSSSLSTVATDSAVATTPTVPINDVAENREEPLLSAREYHRRGRERLQQDDFDGAISLLTQAIRQDPGMALALNARGFAYFKLKNYADAIADYSRAIELDPAYLNAVHNRALARRASGDQAGAAADRSLEAQLSEKN